ncbi:MAG: aminotransferase class V-fold PLP-dependent enzyme [Ilumatobacteraceae bacterium]
MRHPSARSVAGVDQANVYVRAGHHCCLQPLMRILGASHAARASYLYNDRSDADALVDALGQASDIFSI